MSGNNKAIKDKEDDWDKRNLQHGELDHWMDSVPKMAPKNEEQMKEETKEKSNLKNEKYTPSMDLSELKVRK